MTRLRSAGAPEGIVSGTCRQTRRRGEAPRGREWVRPWKHAQRALDNAASMIVSSIHTIAQAGSCARRPIQSARKLNCALRQVRVAARQHAEAKRYLTEAAEAFDSAPRELRSGDAPELLEMAAERCQAVAQYICVAANETLLGHMEIFDGVESGEIVPEDPSEELSGGRPRRRVIVLTPRPLFVRAFLTVRSQRVGDRITPLLRRRRRTLLPAEVRVPRRTLLGRAPPLSSTCSL